MATTLWSEFLPGILVDLPGCLEILAERELCNAAIEFCKRTKAWRAQLYPIAVTAGTSTYSLNATQMQARVVQIHDAIFVPATSDGAIELKPKTVQELDAAYPGWRYAQGPASDPRPVKTNWFTQETPDSILLAGVPVYDGTLSILASMAPTRSATGIDSWIADQHFEALVHGAKARLMAMPSKAWTEAKLSVCHLDEFNRAITGAAVEAGTAFQSGAPIRVTGYSK